MSSVLTLDQPTKAILLVYGNVVKGKKRTCIDLVLVFTAHMCGSKLSEKNLLPYCALRALSVLTLSECSYVYKESSWIVLSSHTQ